MTKKEVAEKIHELIKGCIEASGGSIRDPISGQNRTYMGQVEKIFRLMGKISPEPNSGNIREEIPNYNKHLIRKVGRQKISFTIEQQNAARAMLRKMGLI